MESIHSALFNELCIYQNSTICYTDNALLNYGKRNFGAKIVMMRKVVITIGLCTVLSLFFLVGCSADGIIEKLEDVMKVSDQPDDKNIKPEDNETETMVTDELPVIVYETSEYKDGKEDLTQAELPDEEAEKEPETIYDDINKRYTIETADADEIVLAFGGDICFHDDFSNMIAYQSREKGIFDSISAELMEEMKSSDIFMVNNEFPYSDRGTPMPEKKYTFCSKPENVEILHDMGVDIVSLANNHAYDYGEEALFDTFKILNGAKVPFVGAGKNITEAKKPAYFIASEQTISYVAATQIERLPNPDTREATATSAGVLRTLDPTIFLTAIEEAERNSDFVVVYVHWGSENTDVVEDSQRDLATKYIAAGADLIIGDHPHCLQGIEYIEGVPVIYSLGNFWFNSKTVDTCLVKLAIGKDHKIQSFQFIPCMQENCMTHMADEVNAQRIINYMQKISFNVSFDIEGYVSETNVSQQ